MNDLSLPSVSAALLADADRLLLAPSDLDHGKLSQVLGAIHARDVDFADLYFQHARFESWNLEEGIVKSGSFNIDRGVGVRAVAGDKQAYAYSDDISLAALDEAAAAVRAIGRQGQSTSAPLDRRGSARARAGQAGTMTVVPAKGWPGIVMHEAIGHGRGGDFNRKETSAFAGRVGERVASRGITVVDDGTLEERRGSLNLDDEGYP